MKSGNIIVMKSKAFALETIKLYQHLTTEKHEFVLSKQLLRSGTSIGANVKEAIRGESKLDFYHKMAIALKEASETEYWSFCMRAAIFPTFIFPPFTVNVRKSSEY